MNRKLKKTHEQAALYEVFGILELKIEDLICRESPDFEFTVEEKKIGAEITQFHIRKKEARGKSRRSVERFWHSELKEKITRRAHQIDELKNRKGILKFKELWLPNKKEIQNFINQLLSLAMEMVAKKSTRIEELSDCPLLDKYLNSFELQESKCYIDWKWNYDGIVTDPSEIENSLIESISAKTAKEYDCTPFGELWLIIYSQSAYLSQVLILDEEIFQSYISLKKCAEDSNFDKIIVADCAFDKVIEWPGWNLIGQQK